MLASLAGCISVATIFRETFHKTICVDEIHIHDPNIASLVLRKDEKFEENQRKEINQISENSNSIGHPDSEEDEDNTNVSNSIGNL